LERSIFLERSETFDFCLLKGYDEARMANQGQSIKEYGKYERNFKPGQ
jgi:hypothetical protein